MSNLNLRSLMIRPFRSPRSKPTSNALLSRTAFRPPLLRQPCKSTFPVALAALIGSSDGGNPTLSVGASAGFKNESQMSEAGGKAEAKAQYHAHLNVRPIGFRVNVGLTDIYLL